ncbi:MAG: transglycosylase SLT domain-containing protein [Candidatus Humimicrobiaceae bacterium]
MKSKFKIFISFLVIVSVVVSFTGCLGMLSGSSSPQDISSASSSDSSSVQTSTSEAITSTSLSLISDNNETTSTSRETEQTSTTAAADNDSNSEEIKDTGDMNDLPTQRYYFQLGINNFEEGKYVEAQYYLDKVRSKYFIMADYISFYISKSMLMQKKYDLAAEGYKSLIESYPQSIFREKAQIELADSYYLAEDFVKAIEHYKLFYSKFSSSELVSYALFQEGVASEKTGNNQDAYGRYKKIYLEYPTSEYAAMSLDNLTRLSQESGLPVFEPAIVELYSRAEKLFSVYYYEAALKDLNKIIETEDVSNKYPEIYAKSLFKTGMSYFNMNSYENARNYLKQCYDKFPTGEYADDCLYYLGRSLTNLNSYDEALNSYKKLLDIFPQSNYGDDSLYRSGRISYIADDWQNAAFYFQRLIDEYPDGDKLSDGYWELGWIQYRLEEFENAAITFKNMAAKFNGGALEEKGLFWQAKSFLKLNRNIEAMQLFEKTFSQDPLSYYGFASAEILKKNGSSVAMPDIDKDLNPQNPEIEEIIPEIYDELVPKKITEVKDATHINKAKELLFIKFYDSAAAEIAASKNETDSDPEKLLEISTLYLLSKDYENSIAIVQKNYSKLASTLTGNKKDYYYFLFYPYAYKDLVLKYCTKYNVEPDFLLAIIREESRFKADAGSHAGAQGLMQIMPATGKSIANQIGINYSESILHDPETSITMGSYYISQMLANFSNNKYFALGAYNGGPGAMQRWISKYGGLDIDEFIESLTYDETKNYIKKVMASYFIYDFLYE